MLVAPEIQPKEVMPAPLIESAGEGMHARGGDPALQLTPEEQDHMRQSGTQE